MRFIHIADVHLGASPDSDFSWGVQREKEIWTTFQKMIRFIRQEKVELLLIAGDLFHRQPLLRELREVQYLFSTIPDTEVVWIAGNHDYLKRDSAYRKVVWGANVHGFFSQQREVKYLEKLDTWIYGLSYEEREIREALYHGFSPNGESGHHILLAHGGDETHIPIKKEDCLPFTYVALGHIHKPQSVIANQTAYAGALEPIDRNDLGEHGFIYGEIDEDHHVKIRFVPMACRSYQYLDVTIHSGTTQLGLEQKVREAIMQKGEQHMYRIRIRGFRSPDMEFDKSTLYEAGNVIEVIDESKPRLDIDKLRKQEEGALVGEYIRSFEGRNRVVEQKALYYGLQALLEEGL